MKHNLIGQATALLMLSGAASAALPPVIDGNGASVSERQPATGMVSMYNQLEQLQNEVQQLRGQVEEQAFIIESLKKQQRDLYLDTDRRIQAIESGGCAVQSQSAVVGSNEQINGGASSGSEQPLFSDNQDKLVYEKAFSSIKSGRYKQAITDFTDFTNLFPNSTYLPNAWYWLGEASYVNHDFNQAFSAFDKVVSQYPTHAKAKDALLKMGFIHYENQKWQQARKFLSMVTTNYPSSTAARLANQRLERMRQEKR